MKNSKFINSIFVIILFIISIFFSINNYTQYALITCILTSILLFFCIKDIVGNYTNITLAFVAFSTLYGISGPISVVWGEGLHPIFSTPFYTNAFLISYALANIGIMLGIITYNIIYFKQENDNIRLSNSIDLIYYNRNSIISLSIWLSAVGSLFEIINLFRIGGISILFAGKATYQSLVSELTLTLPSSDVFVVVFALLGIVLGISYKEKSISIITKKKLFVIFIFSAPYLLITIILGGRILLLTLFISLFIGSTYFKPVKKLKPKLAILLIVVYVFLSFVYSNRAIVSLIFEDPQLFVELSLDKDRLISALNPGGNEFGAAFANYSEFYGKYRTDFTPQYGRSYIKGLVLPIPSFMYLGTKPIQITYEFRDEFFISEASRGSIAGTGFSSILEAYINFKYFGVFFIYLFFGYFLQKVDRKYKYKNLFLILLYITSFSQTISFHRSAFGDIFSSVILRGMIILSILVFFKKVKKRNQISPIC